jgi:hypothetical protein
MPRLREDNAACEKVIVKYLRKHVVATGPQLNEAMRRKGLKPSTLARWNVRNRGLMKAIKHGRPGGRSSPGIYLWTGDE